MGLRGVAVLMAVAVALSGCGLFVSKETRALRKSPDYRAGYQDGCNSAYGPDADKRHDDNTVRDDEAYRSNKAYRSGWNTGLTACRASTYDPSRMPGMSNSGPIRDMNPGNGGLPPR